ncbi:MAG: FAD-dependent oxidoreductase [Janthinobacterium lividum]
MRVLVLGAGVIGLTTAWALTEAGCDVTIIDRNETAGGDASPGNGAQLSYNFVAPFASPETLRHLPALLRERDGPTRMRPGLDPAFMRWGIAFLRNCTTEAVRRTTVAQLALAALSRLEMQRLNGALPLEFGLRRAGKLVVHRDPGSFEAARRQVERHMGLGAEQHVLSPRECLTQEPGLRIVEAALAGGVFTPDDEVGDCAAFCQDMAAQLRMRNTVAWQLGTACTPVLREGRVIGVQVGAEVIEAEQTILCLGAGAAAFGRAAGLNLAIVPMKGYSLTLSPHTPLRHSVTDAARKIVFAPLESPSSGPSIRVAGIADFVGQDRRIDARRLAAMTRAATEALDVDWTAPTRPWTGLRPVTPDSRPLIGASRIPGLFLNTGHGGLGWTLAAGSARLTTELLLDRPASVSPEWFSPAR